MLAFLCAIVNAQSIDTSGVWKMLPGSAKPVSLTADTTVHHEKTDTLHKTPTGAAADSTSKQLPVSNLKLIKRNYDSRQQVLLASGMMVFVIAIVTLAQQFNPD